MKRHLIIAFVFLLSFPIEALSGQTAGVDPPWRSIKLVSGKIAHVGDPSTITQTKGTETALRQVNLAIILDASGSMKAKLPGTGRTKLAIAKEVMAELVPQIPDGVRGSLWIYGHRYPQKPKSNSCKDIQKVFPLGAVDATAYIERIKSINAIGYTPIADALKQAAEEFAGGEDQINAIILVSDGEETCGGDPCALAEALKASQASITIHVVGYAVDSITREQLQCIAHKSGGIYHDAEDPSGLFKGLEMAMATSVGQAILRVELLGPDGAEVHGNVHLFEPDTEQRHKVNSYVAWKDNVVPPGSYDMMVDTLPWIIYQDLRLEEGSITVARIPLGSLMVKGPSGRATDFDLLDNDTRARLGHYTEVVFVAPGEYHISVNNSRGDAIIIVPAEARVVTLGSIRAVGPDGKAHTVDVYDSSGRRLGSYGEDILLVPGTYRVGIHQSMSNNIKVMDGAIAEIKLASIRALGPDGEPKVVDVYDARRRRLGSWGDDILLTPGDYRIGINQSISEIIGLEGGKVITIKLGAIQMKEGTLFDESGKRLGYYKGQLLLVPGIYALKAGKSKFENIKVKAGEVTILDQ